MYKLLTWYLEPIYSLAVNNNFSLLIVHFLALGLLYFFYSRTKSTWVRVALGVLLAWLWAFSYFFVLSFFNLIEFFLDINFSEMIFVILFIVQVFVPVVIIYWKRSRFKKMLLEKKKSSVSLFIFLSVFLSSIYYSLGSISLLHKPYQEHFKEKSWYTLHRRSLLYSLRNIGMSYVDTEKGLALPGGYVVLHAYHQNVDTKTWFIIAGFDYVIFMVYLGVTHSVLLVLAGNTTREKKQRH